MGDCQWNNLNQSVTVANNFVQRGCVIKEGGVEKGEYYVDFYKPVYKFSTLQPPLNFRNLLSGVY